MAAFRKGDRALVVAGTNGPVRQWPRPADDAKKFVDWTPPSDSLLGTPEGLASVEPLSGDVVLIATTTGSVSVIDLRAREILFSRQFVRFGSSDKAIGTTDGRYIAYSGRLFDRQVDEEMGRPSPVDADSILELSRDGTVIVNAGYHLPRVVVRSTATGEVREWQTPDSVVAGALAPSGEILAAVLKGGQIVIWRLAGGKPIAEWEGPAGGRWLRFSEDGTRLTVGDDAGISCYDARTSQRLFRGNADGRNGALYAFAGAGDVVAAGSWNGVVYLWDVARGTLVSHRRVSAAGPIKALAVDAVGQVVAAADLVGEISLLRWR